MYSVDDEDEKVPILFKIFLTLFFICVFNIWLDISITEKLKEKVSKQTHQVLIFDAEN